MYMHMFLTFTVSGTYHGNIEQIVPTTPTANSGIACRPETPLTSPVVPETEDCDVPSDTCHSRAQKQRQRMHVLRTSQTVPPPSCQTAQVEAEQQMCLFGGSEEDIFI